MPNGFGMLTTLRLVSKGDGGIKYVQVSHTIHRATKRTSEPSSTCVEFGSNSSNFVRTQLEIE